MTQENETSASDETTETLSAAATEPAAETERVKELEAELAKSKNDVLYAKAEVENVRRRLETQAEDRAKFAVVNFAKDVLSVADNLRRALDAAPLDANDTLTVGVQMTERELLNALDRYGIKPIIAKGQRFDANLHQAMMEVEDTTVAPGIVVLEMQTGYKIHDRLLRPSLVGVSKGGPKVSSGEQMDTSA